MRIGLAIALLLSSAAAQADQQCVSEAELGALVAAAAPPALNALTDRCSASLPEGDYLRTNGHALAQRFADVEYDKPLLVSGLGKFGGHKLPEAVSPASISSILNDMVAGEVRKMDPGHCKPASRLVASLSGMEPRAFISFVIAFFAIADVKKPSICRENG